MPLETIALQHGMSLITIGDVRGASAERRQYGQLIEVAVKRHPNGAYTTAEVLAHEAENIALMRVRLGRAIAVATAEEVIAWAEKRALSEEQTAALQLTLADSDWAVAIEGGAGTAKTTTVGALRDFASKRGNRVEGFGPTTAASCAR